MTSSSLPYPITKPTHAYYEVESRYRLAGDTPCKVKTGENTYDFVYEITFSTSKDMRSHVFDFAHDNDLKILQLNQKNTSLEKLFRDLTSK